MEKLIGALITFSALSFVSNHFLVVAKAILQAFSLGNPYTPVAMQQNA